MKFKQLTTLCMAAGIAATALGFAGSAAADDSHWPKTRWGSFGAHKHHGDPRACARSPRQLDRNVRTAIAYYTLAFNSGEPELAVEKYVGVDRDGNKIYTQHNPFAADGPQAFIDFVNFFKTLNPDLNVNIVRTIAQCDLVVTHAHITTGPDDLGNAAMDIFRFDARGKIVEHWDAVQPVVENPANDNTQF
ncbi:MAG TPA: nuclear transport factor 2 family protein [Gammaproteobacteria bacterium]|nr:nuclear transport factor 2 family protein [Gammaproteobacteria bacterium]